MIRQADLFGPGAVAGRCPARPTSAMIDVPLRALTYLQPWASLHANGVKMVENRTWRPSPSLLAPGGTYAIHAGLRHDRDAYWIPWIPASYRSCPSGAIVAVARLGSFHSSRETLPEDQRDWFCGPWGWLSSEVLRLPEPIPCRGARMLWEIPSDIRGVLAAAMARYER